MSINARVSAPGSSGACRASSARNPRPAFSSWVTLRPGYNSADASPASTAPGSREERAHRAVPQHVHVIDAVRALTGWVTGPDLQPLARRRRLGPRLPQRTVRRGHADFVPAATAARYSSRRSRAPAIQSRARADIRLASRRSLDGRLRSAHRAGTCGAGWSLRDVLLHLEHVMAHPPGARSTTARRSRRSWRVDEINLYLDGIPLLFRTSASDVGRLISYRMAVRSLASRSAIPCADGV